MKRTALLALLFAAACGGKNPAPAQPEAAEPAAPAEPAPAAEPAAVTEPAAPAPAPADDGVLAQAALTEQYELGKQIYAEKKCDSCHGGHGEGGKKSPAVIGETALPEQAPKGTKLRKGIAFKTAKDVLDFVKAKMPIKKPGTLTDDEAAAVTAWMLSESKVNIERKLDADNAASIQLR